MTQDACGGELSELDLRDELGAEPLHTACVESGDAHQRVVDSVERLELLLQGPQHRIREARADPAGIPQPCRPWDAQQERPEGR